MSKFKMKWGVATAGKLYSPNEDSHIENTHSGIFIISDGMGGNKRGTVASKMATELTSRTLEQTSIETEKTWLYQRKGNLSLEQNFLRMALLHTNAKIVERAEREQEDQQGSGQWMGASVTAALLTDTKIIVGNIGVCRAYLFRKDRLTQLTEDGSLAKYKKWIPFHPHHNIPINFLGKSSSVDMDSFYENEIKKNDLYIFMTPGVTNTLSHEDLIKHIQKNRRNIKSLASSMVKAAHLASPLQDATILVLQTTS